MIPSPFGSDQWGVATCLVCSSPTSPQCGKPAHWHAMVTEDDSTALCAAHLLAFAESIPDLHHFGGVCGIPGAVWQPSAGGEMGYCSIPIAATDVLTTAADQSAGAGA